MTSIIQPTVQKTQNTQSTSNDTSTQKTVLKKQKADSFDLQPRKKKINKNKLAIIGGILAAAAGTIAFIVSKRRFKLPENIAFKPAETVEEAIEFGKKQLGIKNYFNLAKDGDIPLELINYNNEGFVKLVNKTKGKVTLPDYVCVVDNVNENGFAGAISNMDLSSIGKGKNRRCMLYSQSSMQKINPTLGRSVKNKATGKMLTKTEIEKIPFKDRMLLYNSVGKVSNNYSTSSPFHALNHEIGHFEHNMNVGKEKYSLLTDYSCSSEAAKEFLSNSKTQKIAASVSKYAKTTPGEYVAEVYTKLMNGEQLSDEVLELYKKYGGKLYD